MSALNEPLIALTSSTAIFTGVFVAIWYLFIRKYVKVYILKEYGDAYKIVKIKKIGFKKDGFTWDGMYYIIDLTRSVFSLKRNLPELFFKKGQVKPITFQVKTNPISASMVKDIMEASLFRNLFGGVMDKMYFFMVIGLVAGICAIAIYSVWQISALQSEIAKLLSQSGPQVLP